MRGQLSFHGQRSRVERIFLDRTTTVYLDHRYMPHILEMALAHIKPTFHHPNCTKSWDDTTSQMPASSISTLPITPPSSPCNRCSRCSRIGAVELVQSNWCSRIG